MMPLVIAATADVAQGIRSFDLVQPDGSELPPFTPGSHVKVRVPSGSVRKYSLCNDPSERHRYVIAVKRDDNGQGGSVSLIYLAGAIPLYGSFIAYGRLGLGELVLSTAAMVPVAAGLALALLFR